VDADLITQLNKQRKHEARRPGKPGGLEKVKSRVPKGKKEREKKKKFIIKNKAKTAAETKRIAELALVMRNK
jgi:hypothetical protein